MKDKQGLVVNFFGELRHYMAFTFDESIVEVSATDQVDLPEFLKYLKEKGANNRRNNRGNNIRRKIYKLIEAWQKEQITALDGHVNLNQTFNNYLLNILSKTGDNTGCTGQVTLENLDVHAL